MCAARILFGVAMLAGLACSPTARASQAQPVGGEFSVTPARRYVVARPPIQLASATVANSTRGALRVKVFPVLLTQQQSGSFSFDGSAAALGAARAILKAGPTVFELPPGGSRQIALRWRSLPHRARVAAVGVVYQATPVHGSDPVQIVERLLGVNILRLPGHYRRSGRLTGVHVTQIKPGVLRFNLSVQNTGDAVAGPSRIALSIRNRAGALRLRTGIVGDIVLPGATRDFVVDVKRRLPAGAYTARGHVAFGSSHELLAADSFRLAAPNELSAARLQIGPLFAQGSIGGSAEVTATVKNSGSAAGTTSIDLSLYQLTDGVPASHPISTRRVTVQALAPRDARRLESSMGRLQAGTYRLLASYSAANGAPQTLVADFAAHRRLGLFARLRSFNDEHGLLIPLLLLLCVGGFAMMLLRERRLKNELRRAGSHGH
jgi:hypothetical protein